MNPDANRHISATLKIISLTILTSAANFNAELKNKRQIKINVETEKAKVKAWAWRCGIFHCLPWQLPSPLKSVNERGFFTTSLLKMKRRKCCHLEYNQQKKGGVWEEMRRRKLRKRESYGMNIFESWLGFLIENVLNNSLISIRRVNFVYLPRFFTGRGLNGQAIWVGLMSYLMVIQRWLLYGESK